MIVIIQPFHAKFLLCHDGIIRGVVNLLAVDCIFNRHLVALFFLQIVLFYNRRSILLLNSLMLFCFFFSQIIINAAGSLMCHQPAQILNVFEHRQR